MPTPFADAQRGRVPSAEMDLLLCLSRADLSEEARERAVALLGEGLDWNAFVSLAERHGVVPLVNRNLEAPGPSAIPRACRARLWARSQRTHARNRTMTKALLEILRALDAAGVVAMPYKGPALSQQIYRDVSLREYGDLDVLVPSSAVPDAKRALSALGYEPDADLTPDAEKALMRSRLYYHLVFFRPADQVLVELHWKTDAEFAVESTESRDWWLGLRELQLQGETVRAFHGEELLLVLLLHGAKHGWARLAWLVDAAELMRQAPGLSWPRIEEIAKRLGCARRVAAGLILAHRLLDAPVPESVLQGLCNSPQAGAAASKIAANLLDPASSATGALPTLIRDVGLYDRPMQRLAHARSVVFDPTLAEWSRWRLPPAFHFAYRPLRLFRLLAKYGSRSGQL